MQLRASKNRQEFVRLSCAMPQLAVLFETKFEFFSKISSKRFAICDLGYILSNMHQQVQSCFGKPTWRNWQTRTVQVRVPRGMRVRLPPSVPFIIQGVINTPRFQDLLRVWHNGCAPAFQAGYTGSTPVTRSSCQRTQLKYKAGFPSGQRGQTVNLLAMLSMVRIHLQPPS